MGIAEKKSHVKEKFTGVNFSLILDGVWKWKLAVLFY
jgi:hypothetical protein